MSFFDKEDNFCYLLFAVLLLRRSLLKMERICFTPFQKRGKAILTELSQLKEYSVPLNLALILWVGQDSDSKQYENMPIQIY